MNLIDSPVWLHEQPDVLKLLHLFVDKLDSKPAIQWSQSPAISISEKTIPALFVQGDEADQVWSLLNSLDQDYHLFEIRLQKKRNRLDPEYVNARVRLRDGAEQVLRSWLDRPYEISQQQRWRTALDQHKDRFPGDVTKLCSRPIVLRDRSAQEIVQGFARIADYRQHNLTLRQLSALCFWGRSKFLDGRGELLASLYPDLTLSVRPVVVNVFLPLNIEGVLFIENQDSYTCAMQGSPAYAGRLALVYSAGFKGSAARIRDPGGVSLHFCGEGVHSNQASFERFWREDSFSDWPAWFWGDLDYAGMNILKQLIKRFLNLRAWQPGYRVQLQQLLAGNGYTAGCDNEQAQTDPQTTGCAYADDFLLPELRRRNLFVDQEIVY